MSDLVETSATESPEQAPSGVTADNTSRQLDPRFIRLERVVGYITSAVLSLLGLFGVLAIVVFASFTLVTITTLLAAWALATAGCAWLSHRWPEYEYERASYTVADDVIEIRDGVWWRHTIKVPRTRVQHIDVAQGPLERRYGLATLVIHTAGTEHAKVDLTGLDRETALAIRDHLLPREATDAV